VNSDTQISTSHITASLSSKLMDVDYSALVSPKNNRPPHKDDPSVNIVIGDTIDKFWTEHGWPRTTQVVQCSAPPSASVSPLPSDPVSSPSDDNFLIWYEDCQTLGSTAATVHIGNSFVGIIANSFVGIPHSLGPLVLDFGV